MAFKKTIADMQALAERRKGQCISQDYRGMEAKLSWRCEHGHEWQAVPERIKAGSWCPRCAILAMRDTIEQMAELARERGGRCLSTEYINTNTALLWECAEGHQWKAQPASIKAPRASWCPVCAKGKNRKETLAWAQNLAREKGGECLSSEYKGTTVHLEWRCGEGHIWTAPPFLIAAGQWCKSCYHESMRFSLADMQTLAARHNGRCVSRRYVDAKSLLLWECEKGHRWRAKVSTIQRSWCPTCAFDRKRLGIEKMHELAAGHRGKCLSETYINQTTPMQWQCEKGHVWSARPMKIVIGHWCHICAIDGMRLGIEKMRETAAANGGRCLSDTYVNSITPLQWECFKGHVWSAKPDSVRRGTWCPNCAILARTKKRAKRKRYDVDG